jgi:hypothetical protein
MNSITLFPSKKKWLAMLFGSSAFVAVGVLQLQRGGLGNDVIAWIGICFFGLGIPISLLMLVPGLNALVLTPDGLSVRTFGRTPNIWIMKWSDINNFSVMEFQRSTLLYRPRLKLVGISFDPAARDKLPKKRVGRMEKNRLKYGCDGALPDTYGMKVENLVRLLNEWRIKNSPNHSSDYKSAIS